MCLIYLYYMKNSTFKVKVSAQLIFLIFSSVLVLSACGLPQSPVASQGQSVQTDKSKELTADLSTDSPIYQDYTAENYQALLGKEPMVLYFYAAWCPACREQDKNIIADLANFPKKTKILKANYDTERELKVKYGIQVQTSFVVLDSSGKVVASLLDPSLDDLKSAIGRSL